MKFSDVVKAACQRSGDPIPNIDQSNGVAYGVASGEEIPDWFWEEAESVYLCSCPACGHEMPDSTCVVFPDSCPGCELEFDDDESWWGDEPVSWIIDRDGFQAEAIREGTIVMIYKSPNVVQCNECSMCYPCAGDLGTAGQGDMPTYGFPEDNDG
jgi:hypothetical protein